MYKQEFQLGKKKSLDYISMKVQSAYSNPKT